MPPTRLLFFKEADGAVPVKTWLEDLQRTNRKAFHGKDVAVLAHALTKEDEVPEADIERAIRRKAALERNPETHIYEEDDDGETRQDH